MHVFSIIIINNQFIYSVLLLLLFIYLYFVESTYWCWVDNQQTCILVGAKLNTE